MKKIGAGILMTIGLLAGCGPIQRHQMEQQAIAAQSQISSCLAQVRSDASYGPLKTKMLFFSPTSKATIMANGESATDEESRLILKLADARNACMAASDEQLRESLNPSLYALLKQREDESQVLQVKLATKKITYGDYAIATLEGSQRFNSDYATLRQNADAAEERRRHAAAQMFLQQQAIQNANRPRTTNCYGMGNSAQCTTY